MMDEDEDKLARKRRKAYERKKRWLAKQSKESLDRIRQASVEATRRSRQRENAVQAQSRREADTAAKRLRRTAEDGIINPKWKNWQPRKYSDIFSDDFAENIKSHEPLVEEDVENYIVCFEISGGKVTPLVKHSVVPHTFQSDSDPLVSTASKVKSEEGGSSFSAVEDGAVSCSYLPECTSPGVEDNVTSSACPVAGDASPFTHVFIKEEPGIDRVMEHEYFYRSDVENGDVLLGLQQVKEESDPLIGNESGGIEMDEFDRGYTYPEFKEEQTNNIMLVHNEGVCDNEFSDRKRSDHVITMSRQESSGDINVVGEEPCDGVVGLIACNGDSGITDVNLRRASRDETAQVRVPVVERGESSARWHGVLPERDFGHLVIRSSDQNSTKVTEILVYETEGVDASFVGVDECDIVADRSTAYAARFGETCEGTDHSTGSTETLALKVENINDDFVEDDHS